jgi:hypothetical protein
MTRRLVALLLVLVLLPVMALAATPSNASPSNTRRHSTRTNSGSYDYEVPTSAVPSDGPVTVRAVGCTVQRASASGKGLGGATSEITFNEGIGNVYIAAEIPTGRKIAYWVINGVRYDFNRIPVKFPVLNVNQDLTIECVLRNGSPRTLLTADDIEAMRTDEPLVVSLNKAEMCHLLTDTKGGGGWITSFDFTNDYRNRATGATVRGGTYTFKMRPTKLGNRTVRGWKFNDMEFRFSSGASDVIVRGLNTSMTYEPLFK